MPHESKQDIYCERKHAHYQASHLSQRLPLLPHVNPGQKVKNYTKAPWVSVVTDLWDLRPGHVWLDDVAVQDPGTDERHQPERPEGFVRQHREDLHECAEVNYVLVVAGNAGVQQVHAAVENLAGGPQQRLCNRSNVVSDAALPLLARRAAALGYSAAYEEFEVIYAMSASRREEVSICWVAGGNQGLHLPCA